MKILFYHHPLEHRAALLTYDNVYEQCGFSGTETALVELAGYLATHGCTVKVVGLGRETYTTSDGVLYEPLDLQAARAFDPDWYCPLFWIMDHQHAQLLSVLDPKHTRVLIWMHGFLHNHQLQATAKRGFRVYAQYVSEFVEQSYAGTHLFQQSWTIGNGLHEMFLCDTLPASKAPGRWVFHTTYERGGAVTQRVFNRVKAQRPESATELIYASYYTPDRLPSLSKRKVAELLASSEYFVYSLALPASNIVHDTFASCVLEALARGVIVITWDVACLGQVFGDTVVRLPPLPCAGYDPKARWSSNRRLLSDEAVRLLADAVLRIEGDPVEKRRLQEAGIQFAQHHRWSGKGEAMLQQLQLHQNE